MEPGNLHGVVYNVPPVVVHGTQNNLVQHTKVHTEVVHETQQPGMV